MVRVEDLYQDFLSTLKRDLRISYVGVIGALERVL